MTCHDIQHQLYRFMDGRLDDVASEVVLQHLKTCARCRAEG